MAKGNLSVDRIIKKAAQEAAQDAIQSEITNQFNPGEDDDGELMQRPDPLDDEDLQVEELIKSLPGVEGYYLKLYKEFAPGKFEFKERIDDFITWTDMENEIAQIVRLNTQKSPSRWGSGRYRITIHKDGTTKTRKPQHFMIDAGELVTTPIQQEDPTETVNREISKMSGLMKSVKDLMPNQTPTNPADLSKTLTDSFKMGMEAMKSAMPLTTPAPQNATSMDMMQQMVMMVKMMKELGLIPDTAVKKEDPLDLIVKLKTAGLIKTNEEESPTKSIDTALKLMETMAPLMNNKEGLQIEPPSIWAKLLEVISPAVPKVVETISALIEMKKMQMVHQSIIPPSTSTKLSLSSDITSTSGDHPVGVPSTEIPSVLASKNEHIKGNYDDILYKVSQGNNGGFQPSSRNPLTQQILDAIKTNNIAFYPNLKDILITFVSKDIMDNLASGELTVISLLTQASTMLQENGLVSPAAQDYFQNFVNWYIEINTQSIKVQCEKCNEIFQDIEENLKNNPLCECGGILKKVETVKVNE